MAAGITFWGTGGIATTLLPASVLALPVMIGFRLRKRRNPTSATSFGRVVLAWTLGLYLCLCGLHFVHRQPSRFKFLGTHQKVFSVEPTWPCRVGAAYTFPADWNLFSTLVESEMKSLGYEVSKDGQSIEASLVGTNPMTNYGVYAHVGKATGKHFMVDGDFVDTEPKRGWVTVQTFEPDLLPFWIQIWIP